MQGAASSFGRRPGLWGEGKAGQGGWRAGCELQHADKEL